MTIPTDFHARLHGGFRWQVPARFNIAQVCCTRWARGPGGAKVAVAWEHEDGRRGTLSYRELQRQADRLSHALRRRGVQRGDRVAVVMPQRPETAVAHMAIYQLGAVAMPLSMLFGPEALEYRLHDSAAGVAICDETSIDNLLAEARYNAFRSFGKNWYGSLQLQTDVSFPFESAYINQRLMGYGEFYLRGLEYYVIDGYHASMAKFTLKKKIWGFTIPIPWKIKAIPSVPFQFFAKTYADAGYAIIQSKREAWLNNRPLYTSGFGIDVLTLYDLNLKFEYSINQFGEKGLFLHAKSSF